MMQAILSAVIVFPLNEAGVGAADLFVPFLMIVSHTLLLGLILRVAPCGNVDVADPAITMISGALSPLAGSLMVQTWAIRGPADPLLSLPSLLFVASCRQQLACCLQGSLGSFRRAPPPETLKLLRFHSVGSEACVQREVHRRTPRFYGNIHGNRHSIQQWNQDDASA